MPPEKLDDLLAKAIDEAELLATQLQTAVDGETGRIAHRLRGAFGTYGMAAVSDLGGRIEDGILAGADVSTAGRCPTSDRQSHAG